MIIYVYQIVLYYIILYHIILCSVIVYSIDIRLKLNRYNTISYSILCIAVNTSYHIYIVLCGLFDGLHQNIKHHL